MRVWAGVSSMSWSGLESGALAACVSFRYSINYVGSVALLARSWCRHSGIRSAPREHRVTGGLWRFVCDGEVVLLLLFSRALFLACIHLEHCRNVNLDIISCRNTGRCQRPSPP